MDDARRHFPRNRELQEARRNVMRRHPLTQFVCLHAADSEDLPYVSECMDSHPNMSVDIAARISELGRQPRMARRFFGRCTGERIPPHWALRIDDLMRYAIVWLLAFTAALADGPNQIESKFAPRDSPA